MICMLVSDLIIAQQPTTSSYYFIRPIYAFAGNAAKLSENTATLQGVTYTKGVYGSYGRGWGIQAGFGKMLNRNFGFELAGEYFGGKKLEETYTADDVDVQGNSSGRINAAMVKPLLVLRNSGDLLSIYSKLGLAISVWSRRFQETSLLLNIANQDQVLATNERHKIGGKVGFAAAFGLSFRIKEAMAVITELNGQMMSLPVHSGSYNKYNLNGREILASLTTSQRSWTYERSISTTAGSSDRPSTRLYEPANFSYVGLSIGLVHYF